MRGSQVKRFLISVALCLGIAVPIVAGATAHTAGADPPPTCQPYPECQHEPCPTSANPSGICPPWNGGFTYDPHYNFVGAGTGALYEDGFTGTSIDSSVWGAQSVGEPGPCHNKNNAYPDSSCNNVWDSTQTTVSGGELHLSTSYGASSNCTTYYGSSPCWISGGIYQKSSGTGYWPWINGGQIAVAFELTGSTAIDNLDNVLQTGAYPTWPPEIDYIENATSGGYNIFVHCGNSTDGTQQLGPYNETPNLDQWGVAELDWTTSKIVVTYTPIGSGGSEGTPIPYPIYKPTDTSKPCYKDWPDPAHAMGAFLQDQLTASNTNSGQQGNTDTINVDWVAEQAL